MSTRQDYIAEVRKLVPGDNLALGEPEIILAVAMALKEYSKHRPRVVVEDESGDGGFDYAVTDLAEWSDGFSVIKQVEYPVDDTDEDADILEEDQWTLYETPFGKCLRFLEDKPSATEEFRVTYTTLHTCTDDACTVKVIDEEAVQALAASKFCDMLATAYAQNQDGNIQADSVDQKGQATEYANRAKMYRRTYLNHLGIRDGMVPAASVTHDHDMEASWGSGWISHGRRTR